MFVSESCAVDFKVKYLGRMSIPCSFSLKLDLVSELGTYIGIGDQHSQR